MNGLPDKNAHTRRMHRTQRRLWPLATAALAAALIGSSCSTIGQIKEGSFAPIANILRIVLEKGDALCASGSDPVALCVPRPQPKLGELREMRLNLLPVPLDRPLPSHLLCEVRRDGDRALAQCAELYTTPPR